MLIKIWFALNSYYWFLIKLQTVEHNRWNSFQYICEGAYVCGAYYQMFNFIVYQ